MASGYIQNGEVVIVLEPTGWYEDQPVENPPRIPPDSEFQRSPFNGVRLSRHRAGFATIAHRDWSSCRMCAEAERNGRYAEPHRHADEVTWVSYSEVSEEWGKWVFDNKVVLDG